MPQPSAAWLRSFQRRLLRWFDLVARDLPWRKRKDAYGIWLSEIMLQQTQVDTVVPYYERFLASFPAVQDLADAPLDVVLKHWAGLGYYRRARQLHQAATQVVNEHDGQFPQTAEALTSLAGVGRYTAGAVASMAFGEATPAVDGNVIRVLSRVFMLQADMRQPKNQREVWERAAALMPHTRCGDHNQALMELGAIVCRPKSPRCGECPIQKQCLAFEHEATARLPKLTPKKKPIPVEATALVWRQGTEVLLGRRPPTGLFAGLWEPPMVTDSGAEAHALFARGGLPVERASEAGRVTHTLSHRRYQVVVLVVESDSVFLGASGGASGARTTGDLGDLYAEFAWTRPADRALSTFARKILAAASPIVGTSA